jgi:hypothetical protein
MLSRVCIPGVCEENPCVDGDPCTGDLYNSGQCNHDFGPTNCEYGACDANGTPGDTCGFDQEGDRPRDLTQVAFLQFERGNVSRVLAKTKLSALLSENPS